MGRGSEFGETDLSLTYRISEALGLCIASGARTVAVPGFAEPPDEVRSRGAELPARPRCRPRSLRPGRALVLAGVRSRARGARRVSALQPPLVRSRGPAWSSQGLSPRGGRGRHLPGQVAKSSNPFSSSHLVFLRSLLLLFGSHGSPVLPAARLAASSSGELPHSVWAAPALLPWPGT